MKLIVGLGNHGEMYRGTRHNLGFVVLDKLAPKWKTAIKFGALIHKTKDVILAKPTGYYNTSGRTVAAIMKFYKLDLSDLLVVCDDFTIPFGTIRLRTHGSDGGNNGLKSIVAALGSNDFARLRLGTDNSQRAVMGDTDFVLAKWTAEEKELLEKKCLVELVAKVGEWERGQVS